LSNTRELFSVSVKKVRTLLEENGFGETSPGYYAQEKCNCSWRIALLPHEYPDVCVSVRGELGVYFYQVEDLFKRHVYVLNPVTDLTAGMEFSFSHGKNFFERFIGNDQLVFEIRSMSDIAKMCNAINAFLSKDGIPFLENLSTLPGIDGFLNGKDIEKIGALNPANRCFKGFISAKLSGNSRIVEIAEQYRAALSKIDGGRHLEKFDSLVSLMNERKQPHGT
jgi:hypothetical protein